MWVGLDDFLIYSVRAAHDEACTNPAGDDVGALALHAVLSTERGNVALAERLAQLVEQAGVARAAQLLLAFLADAAAGSAPRSFFCTLVGSCAVPSTTWRPR